MSIEKNNPNKIEDILSYYDKLEDNLIIHSDTGFQFCNLCDIIVSHIKDEQEFLDACRYAATIGTIQASYTNFDFLTWVTKELTEREALLGVGLNGIQDNREISFNKELLRKGVEIIKEVNTNIAMRIGINPAARGTLVKPGGNSHLAMGGISSGIGYHHSNKYFRTITANPLEPAAKFFKKYNPHMVKEKPDGDWAIIFPIEAPKDVITVKNSKALDFMEDIMFIYENWVVPGTAYDTFSPGLTHNVSSSVTLRDHEKEQVIDFVWENKDRISAMTFVPYCLDKVYPFAPREEVMTEEDEIKWNYLVENYKEVDWELFNSKQVESENRSADPACVGGHCEL